jgi:hypothetical protein
MDPAYRSAHLVYPAHLAPRGPEYADHLGQPLDLAVETLDRVGRVQVGPMLRRAAVSKWTGAHKGHAFFAYADT